MQAGCYDPETLTMLRAVLDEVWDALPIERQTGMLASRFGADGS